ncbi:NAD(P)H-binding protein [Lactiplantibacillus pentosus]|uniref:Oxidoreductase n=1 Tax=Lactiplantibacillus pentosus TaxID=1589 RepID=A0ABX5CZX9_LACPE|nr:NAD(P)H-binding protein [Lactiplantibacillus pentosus]PRO93375.1 oxidoreductase [Lactiplantibacillus pentosus]
MKIMILGAAGQVARLLTDDLLDQTDFQLVLYGRNVSTRLAEKASERVDLVDGTFEDVVKIQDALKQGVDAVYLNYVAGDALVKPIVDVLEKMKVSRFIAASVPDLYQEVAGPFAAWYRQQMGKVWQSKYRQAADVIEGSPLDYVLLRITWMYNDAQHTQVHLTTKGQPFTESQVTREGVAQLVTDLLTGKQDYYRESLGIGEPDTAWRKPSFY